MRPGIILGPPGTGKTTALLDILERELEAGTEPEEIGFVSFSRKAANEAVTRATERFGFNKDRFIWFRTLHSLCYRTLGVQRGQVFQGRRVREFADWCGVKITGRRSDDGTLTGFEMGDRIMHMNNLARVRRLPLRHTYLLDDDDLPWREVERVVAALEYWKRTEGLYDFTDMLSEFVLRGLCPVLKMLLVDEAQDLSLLQWMVVEKLADVCERVVVAGDDDQAIFEWGGADVDYFVNMQGDEAVLGQSFRVPLTVQRAANEIIQYVHTRRHKEWVSRSERGTLRLAKDLEEVALDDSDTGGASPPILILARNTYLLTDHVEPELRYRGIYYERNGEPSVPRETLTAIVSWERLRKGEQIPIFEARDMYGLMVAGRAFSAEHRDLSDFDDDEQVNMSDLKRRGGLFVDGPWFDAMKRIPDNDVGYIRTMLERKERLGTRPRVRISTIHAAKGGEADHVVLLREMAPRAYREMDKNPDAERRVWYVAATRARSKLTVIDSTTALECPWL